jgi:F420-non-reducing hydrogenase iron-sulfur subunit
MHIRALKTYIFYCSNNLEASQFSGISCGHEGDAVKTISLPCSGKVDVPYLIKAFETGADGVAIVTCTRNECRHFEGNLRAHKRAEAVESLLEEIGVAPGRMAVFECGKGDVGPVLEQIEQFIERVRALPPAKAQASTDDRQESTVA